MLWAELVYVYTNFYFLIRLVIVLKEQWVDQLYAVIIISLLSFNGAAKSELNKVDINVVEVIKRVRI